MQTEWARFIQDKIVQLIIILDTRWKFHRDANIVLAIRRTQRIGDTYH